MRNQNLVARFALASLVAFVVIGVVLSIVVLGRVRISQENQAHFHAQYVAGSVLAPGLTPDDLNGLTPRRMERLSDFVESRVLSSRVQRVKIWNWEGTVIYSDDARQIGTRYQDGHLEQALQGRVATEVSLMVEDENALEKNLADKMLETYVPIEVGDGPNPARAVAEVYQDYTPIEQRTDRLFGALLITLAGGLAVLYGLLFPIVRRVARTLSRQNETLAEQAGQLEEHLRKERETVAQLQELNRLKGEFIAVASHELRTPLTAVVGSLKMLSRPGVVEDDKMREELLSAAGVQADHLQSLVEMLLTQARLEDGQVHLSPAPFSLEEVVREVTVGLDGRAERIQVFIPPGLPVLWNDRPAVRHVIASLMDNALKFSSEDSPVEFGAARVDDSVKFWVRDHGVGIPDDKVGQIFDRFYQVDSSSTRAYRGFGLGLSLVKDLLAFAEGSIEVVSDQGRGSTFTVTLPIRHSSVRPSDTSTAQPTPRQPAGA